MIIIGTLNTRNKMAAITNSLCVTTVTWFVLPNKCAMKYVKFNEILKYVALILSSVLILI